MEVSGRIVKSLPKQTGPSKKGGTWTRHQVLIETQGQYPKQIVIDIYDDKAAPLRAATVGTLVDFSVDLSSREYKGNYYTSVTAYKVELSADRTEPKALPQRESVARQPAMPAHPKRAATTTTYEPNPDEFDDGSGDNLPF